MRRCDPLDGRSLFFDRYVDGQGHMDLNVFTYHTVGGSAVADALEHAFLTASSVLERRLRDEQPRGTGRVIVYPKPVDDPVWSL